MSNNEQLCAEVIENMADVLDGSADRRLLDHIATCDACRDARHDAERGRALVANAGADFVVPADLEARLAAAIAQRKPAAPAATRPVRTHDGRRFGRALAGGLAIAAALALAWRIGHAPSTAGGGGDAWRGQVARVSRAGGGAGGLVRCNRDGNSCAPLAAGDAVDAGSVLRTDEQTRAYLHLADGSQLALDRSTEIAFGAGRRAALVRGAVAADV